MDRKKKKTIILLAMILLLVVANGAAGAWNDKSEKKKEKEAEASKIYLTDASDITAYSYSNGSQNMSFTKVDDTWEYDEDNEIPMNQDTVQSTADAIRQTIYIIRIMRIKVKRKFNFFEIKLPRHKCVGAE